ncbi:MAG: hypothetical protein WCQ32_01450 [bacterium]
MKKTKKVCVIALSFGMRSLTENRRDEYGISNYSIAQVAMGYNLPIISQWEISRLLSIEKVTPVLSVESKRGKYLDSRDVLIAAKNFMDQNGFTHAVLVGHHAHLPRVRMIAESMKIDLERDLDNYWWIPYDNFSTQWWTRTWYFWWLREPLVYIHHLTKGWI